MNFGEQITQLLAIIIVLGMAYVGLTFWTKRRDEQLAAKPDGTADGVGGVGGVGGTGGVGGVGGMDVSTEMGGGSDAMASTGGGGNKAVDRLQHLSGSDAEAAAKVLRRMLQDDKDLQKKFKNQ